MKRKLNKILQALVGAALGVVVGITVFEQTPFSKKNRIRLVSGVGLLKHEPEILGEFDRTVEKAADATVRFLRRGKQRALGTIIREDGWILSKASELRGDGLVCRLGDGRELLAKVEKVFEKHDLELVKVNAGGLPVAPWRTGQARAGTVLVAPGSGESGAFAIGIVSVEERSLTHEGKGFLGAGLETRRHGAGVRVTHVLPGFPADVAGLRTGDVLHKFEGANIGNVIGLIDAIAAREPGTKVRLVRQRGEEFKIVHVMLGDRANFFGEFMSAADETHAMGGPLSERRNDFPVVVQTDLVLAPSQCGGPAVDLDGKVAGINIARGARVRSFLIPAQTLKSLLAGFFGE